MFVDENNFLQLKVINNNLKILINDKNNNNLDNIKEINDEFTSYMNKLFKENFPKIYNENINITDYFDKMKFIIGMNIPEELIYIIIDYENYQDTYSN